MIESYNRAAFNSRFQLKLYGKCLPFKCNPIIFYIDQVICTKGYVNYFTFFIVYFNWKWQQQQQQQQDRRQQQQEHELTIDDNYICRTHTYTRTSYTLIVEHYILSFQLENAVIIYTDIWLCVWRIWVWMNVPLSRNHQSIFYWLIYTHFINKPIHSLISCSFIWFIYKYTLLRVHIYVTKI